MKVFYLPWVLHGRWHAYFLLIGVGITLLVTLLRWRGWLSILRPSIVASVLLLLASFNFLVTTIEDSDESATALPSGSLAMSFSGDGGDWEGANVWLAPTVIVHPTKPNLLAFGVDPEDGKHPSFTIWATGEHDFSALFDSCVNSETRHIDDDAYYLQATGFWCEIAPWDRRNSFGQVRGLESLVPVVIEMSGTSGYFATNGAATNGIFNQVGFSRLLGGDDLVFNAYKERPIDQMPADTVLISHAERVDESGLGAVRGSGQGKALALGAGYYIETDDVPGEFRRSVGEQQGRLLLLYGDSQSTPAEWVAGWLIKSDIGRRREELLKNLALIVLGAGVPTFTQSMRRVPLQQ